MRLALALLMIVGCGAPARGAGGDAPAQAKAEPRQPPPLTLKDGGETVRLVQRTSAKLPGSEAYELRIGDVTGGAVELVLSKRDGSAVLVTKSVHDGDVVPFAIEGFDYELVVEHMENLLVGDDWVELRVRAAGQGTVAKPDDTSAVDERARIETLIDAVAKSGVVFIRNGTEHTSSEAADHLRTKWSRAGDRVKTADDFIEALGSRSSQSGEPYRVRMPDGSERDAGPWLRELLAAQ